MEKSECAREGCTVPLDQLALYARGLRLTFLLISVLIDLLLDVFQYRFDIHEQIDHLLGLLISHARSPYKAIRRHSAPASERVASSVDASGPSCVLDVQRHHISGAAYNSKSGKCRPDEFCPEKHEHSVVRLRGLDESEADDSHADTPLRLGASGT